jgi:sugar phosphate isomerase/epimerase
MKIGFGSFALRWHFAEGMDAFELLDLAKNLKAEVVQLCENVKIENIPEKDLAALRRRAEEAGITLEIGVSGGKGETLRTGLRYAKTLGARILRAVVDSDGEAPEAVKHTIRGLLPELRSAGITLCLENHFRFPPATIAEIIRSAGDPHIAACLDPLNSIALLTGPDETLRELKDLAKTAHIKDARIERRGTGFVLSGRPLGDGMLDLPGYIRALSGKVTSLLIEGWMDKMENAEETLREELLRLKNGLDYIRRHK